MNTLSRPSTTSQSPELKLCQWLSKSKYQLLTWIARKLMKLFRFQSPTWKQELRPGQKWYRSLPCKTKSINGLSKYLLLRWKTELSLLMRWFPLLLWSQKKSKELNKFLWQFTNLLNAQGLIKYQFRLWSQESMSKISKFQLQWCKTRFRQELNNTQLLPCKLRIKWSTNR